MSDTKYKIKSTSNVSATVADILIRETKTTRLIMRPELIDNHKDKEASVRATFLFQKKGKNSEWEDFESIPLSKVKADEGVKLELRSGEALTLFKELQNLYSIHKEHGIEWGNNEYVVAKANEIIKDEPARIEVIKQLATKGFSKEVWEQLIKIDPDEVEHLGYLSQLKKRRKAVEDFENTIQDTSLDESHWQTFFETNEWIFGFNLNYIYTHRTSNQPNYGG